MGNSWCVEMGGSSSGNSGAAGSAAEAPCQMDRGFDIQRNQGCVEIPSGRTGHAQAMRAEFQEKEGME